jgi:rod shape-determining protein MreC
MPRNKVAWQRLVFVVLIIASLAVLTVSFRETESGPVHAIQQGTAGLLAPMQSWGARIAQPFQDGYSWLTTLWSAHRDAERLAGQVETLQGQVVELEEQAEENQRLKGLLDLKEKGTFPAGTDFVVSRVISKSPDKWQFWVMIDKGSADGIKVHQAVVGSTLVAGETLAGKGLVGQVSEVTAHSAKVLLITDPQSNVQAKIQGSRAEGVVEGAGSASNANSLNMGLVDRDIRVDPKMVVVTSGYGGVYPADIPLGIVASVGEQDVNNYKQIAVQPFLDFRVLEEVMVLIVPGEPGELGVTTTDTTAGSAIGTSGQAGVGVDAGRLGGTTTTTTTGGLSTTSTAAGSTTTSGTGSNTTSKTTEPTSTTTTTE